MKYIRPHIILEGPDGSGKTTLAKVLTSSFRYRYHHEGPPKKNNMLAEYASIFLEVTRHTEEPVVFDRLHIGETIYGPLLRKIDRVGGPQGVQLLTRLLRAKGAIPVLCCPPLDVVKANWEKNIANELVKDFSTIAAIYKGYLNYMGEHLNVDYTFTPSLDFFWKTINSRTISLDGDFIGAPLSRIVFVGDMPNQNLDLPFFSLTGSSAFFWRCLERAGYSESEILVTNARDQRGTPREREAWLNLLPPGNKTIVALGVNAEQAVLRSYPLNFEAKLCVIDHPQYVKRFHSDREQEYVNILEEIKGLASIEGLYRKVLR